MKSTLIKKSSPSSVGSPPLDKALNLIEAMNASPTDLDLHALHLRSHVPKATLLRLLRTLMSRGYVARVGSHYRLLVRLQHSDTDLPTDFPRSVLQRLQAATGQSAEWLVPRGDALYWQDKLENAALGLMIRAQQGSVRSLYELDSPSRAYLWAANRELVRATFKEALFRRAVSASESPSERKMKWPEIEALVEAGATKEGVCVDAKGNKNGIRRHAVAVRRADGSVLGVLSVAEAALSGTDSPVHFQKMAEILIIEKNNIESPQASKHQRSL